MVTCFKLSLFCFAEVMFNLNYDVLCTVCVHALMSDHGKGRLKGLQNYCTVVLFLAIDTLSGPSVFRATLVLIPAVQ